LRTGTFLRIDSIALGFLLGIFFDKLINYKKMIVLFLLISIFFLVKFEKLLFNNLSLYTLYFIFISQFLSILLVLFFCNLDLVLKNKLIQQICNILASQTYSVYLFHLIVMHFLIMANSLMINNIFVYIFLLLIISSLIYKYFEKPILMLRPKYKNE
jgi:peptidoglycan/LPS O-acetylase OafA/YrhL